MTTKDKLRKKFILEGPNSRLARERLSEMHSRGIAFTVVGDWKKIVAAPPGPFTAAEAEALLLHRFLYMLLIEQGLCRGCGLQLTSLGFCIRCVIRRCQVRFCENEGSLAWPGACDDCVNHYRKTGEYLDWIGG